MSEELSPKQLIEKHKTDIIFSPLKSAEELRNWIYMFFDVYMPMGHVYHESNSSPIEAAWEIYCAVRDNTGDKIPGYIILSCRSGYKTLVVSMLEILLMLHFRVNLAHCAAILDQSRKAVSYCGSFIKKILPYLKNNKWEKTSDNTRHIEFSTNDLDTVYIHIVTLSDKGANSEHCTVMVIDEVDLCSPSAYEEAKKIPNYEKGRFPITIKLSTRKYAFGLMEKAIKETQITGHKLLRWNIVDITEHCPPKKDGKREKFIEEPKQIRYIPISLPLSKLTEEQFNNLDNSQKHSYQKIECYHSCVECKMLSICKMILHDKTSKECSGDLYKPPIATINALCDGDVDVNEAQLLCHKPASSGIIYPRFSEKENVIDVRTAWEMISGATHETNFDLLINYVKNLGVKIESGLDWGFNHNFAMVQGVIMRSNQVFIFDTFAAPGLELDDKVRVGLEIKQRFGTKKIWPDTEDPASIRTFNRKGLKCGNFTKDVKWGIECGRERIINSNNVRNLFIIDVPNNRQLIDAFKTYHWKIGTNGEPTDKPDHTEEADIMDAFRYLLQNVSINKKPVNFSIMGQDKNKVLTDNSSIMSQRVKDLATDDHNNPQNVAKKRFLLM
jgi:hypothetical protein